MENLIYKYYSPTEYNLDALLNQYFWFSKREYLNDPFDLGNFRVGRKLLSVNNILRMLTTKYQGDEAIDTLSNIKQLIPEYACCSFSRSPLNKQMWAYYSKDYTGWCLCFEKGELKTKNESPLLPVIYVDNNLQPISSNTNYKQYGQSTNENLVRRILCTKHESWQHEEEERIILKIKNETKGAKRQWGSYKLNSIIMGNKISEAYCNILKRIATDRQCALLEIQTSKNDFTLTKITI